MCESVWDNDKQTVNWAQISDHLYNDPHFWSSEVTTDWSKRWLLIVNKPGNWRDVAWQEATWQCGAGHGSGGWYDVNGGDTRANVKWCRHWRAVGCTGCLVTTRTTYLVISSARSQSLNKTIHFLHFYTFPWIQNIDPLKWRGHKNCPDHPSWLCHLQTRQQKPQQLINDLYIGVDKSAGHNVITACSVTVRCRARLCLCPAAWLLET